MGLLRIPGFDNLFLPWARNERLVCECMDGSEEDRVRCGASAAMSRLRGSVVSVAGCRV